MLTIDNMFHQIEIGEQNRSYLSYFNKRLGYTPNLFMAMMHSDNALSAYYPFHNRKTSLTKRESEAISLAVSQQNKAMYCLSAHTMIAKLNGFTDEEILEIRKGTALFNNKLNALVKLSKAIAAHPNRLDSDLLDGFFTVGYTQEHLIDTLQVIGDSFITNLIGKALNVPIDYPLAKEL